MSAGVHRSDMQRASGLTPNKFLQAEQLLRGVVIPAEEPRSRRRSSGRLSAPDASKSSGQCPKVSPHAGSGADQTMPTNHKNQPTEALAPSARRATDKREPLTPEQQGLASRSLAQEQHPKEPKPQHPSSKNRETLLERAKAVQSGVPFQRTPATLPSATSESSTFSPRPSAPAPPAPGTTMYPPRAPAPEPAKAVPQRALPRQHGSYARSLASATPVPSGEQNAITQERIRLIALGIPAPREGLKFDGQLKRKRGRPPAKRATPQELQERNLLNTLMKEDGSILPHSSGGVPTRYANVAKLEPDEMHWIRPLPMPLVMSSLDPAAPTLPPTQVWAQWSSLGL